MSVESEWKFHHDMSILRCNCVNFTKWEYEWPMIAAGQPADGLQKNWLQYHVIIPIDSCFWYGLKPPASIVEHPSNQKVVAFSKLLRHIRTYPVIFKIGNCLVIMFSNYMCSWDMTIHEHSDLLYKVCNRVSKMGGETIFRKKWHLWQLPPPCASDDWRLAYIQEQFWIT